MTRFRSAFAVPSGFAVATRAAGSVKAGVAQDVSVGNANAATPSKRARQMPAAIPADRAA